EEDGRLREAALYYDTSRHGLLSSRANYRLGEIYEQLGEEEKARDAWIRFLQAWEDADPDLPQIAHARASLEGLLAN
ncbi:MAG: hypothetical protein ACWGON_08445, partial [Gemmatimonadota bacterium]